PWGGGGAAGGSIRGPQSVKPLKSWASTHEGPRRSAGPRVEASASASMLRRDDHELLHLPEFLGIQDAKLELSFHGQELVARWRLGGHDLSLGSRDRDRGLLIG